MHYGPTLAFSDEIHAQKYRESGENFRDAMTRVAHGLGDDERHFHEFREALLNMRFMPAGRIQAAIGAARKTTPYNCYVSGTIRDSFVSGEGSIMDRATQAATTMRLGGGIGYDFSSLRPRGALIKSLDSRSSGPISFMRIYNEICKCVASAGHRRGAQMGVLRIDHPDIEEFIRVKNNESELTGFNLSIAITDEFMEAKACGGSFKLRWGKEVFKEVDAQELWELVMRSTWDWAEPGVLFINTINRMNNLWYCENIAATNPCGEQPLPPFGACLLGSFNLVKYLTKDASGNYSIDYDQLGYDIPHVVRAMDNVVDRAIYPLPEQQEEAENKRRMGLGVTGLANSLEAMGHPYGSAEFLYHEGILLDFIRDKTYIASAHLAQEKGVFHMYDKEMYGRSAFIQTLGEEAREAVDRFGVRNSHLTSIAPTGTISLAADNVSSAIEPVFAYGFDRTVIEEHGPRTERVDDYGVRVLGVRGKIASQVTIDEHLDVLITAAKRVDSAVSKTCNVGDEVTWDQFKGLYTRAWQEGAKGCTTFRATGKRGGVLVEVKEEEPQGACMIDPDTGRRDCS